MALPRVAPPTSMIAWLVVSVNSSIFARVPGPALFDAIDNGNLEEAKQLRDKLQDWEHFDPDLIRADMQIHRLQRKVKA